MITTCRLCTKSCSSIHATSIFSFNQNRLILDLISIFCPIRIERADNLPQKICNSCLKLILDANELREKSVRSDYKLRQAGFSEIESCEPPNEDVQLEIGNEQAEVTEMVTVKQENPLEHQFLIKEVTSVAEQEESTNLSFLDDFYENEKGVDTGSDYAPPKKSPQNSKRSFIKSKKIRNRNKPTNSKYEQIRGRYKCPMCSKTFAETCSITKHVRRVHNIKSARSHRRKNQLMEQRIEKFEEKNLNFENDLNEASNDSQKSEPSTSIKVKVKNQ